MVPPSHASSVLTRCQLLLRCFRRVFCLLENQQPLVLDAMGTAYVVPKGEVQEQRPAPLRHAHVQAFRNRCVRPALALAPKVQFAANRLMSIEAISCIKSHMDAVGTKRSARVDTASVHHRPTCIACRKHQQVHGGKANTYLSHAYSFNMLVCQSSKLPNHVDGIRRCVCAA